MVSKVIKRQIKRQLDLFVIMLNYAFTKNLEFLLDLI